MRRSLLSSAGWIIAFLGLGSVGYAASQGLRWFVDHHRSNSYQPRFVDAISKDTVREAVLVFVASGNCRACDDEDLPRLIGRAKSTLSLRADSLGLEFATLGVGVDRDPTVSFQQLKRFGLFDEIMGGRGWTGFGVLYFGWDRHPGAVSVPQVIILTRTIVGGNGRIQGVVAEEVRARIVGLNELQRWADAGFRPLDLR